MGLCLPRSRCAISAARRPRTLSAASITNHSRLTSCGLAEKVFTNYPCLFTGKPRIVCQSRLDVKPGVYPRVGGKGVGLKCLSEHVTSLKSNTAFCLSLFCPL